MTSGRQGRKVLQFEPLWNFYRCSACGGYWVTVDVAEGVTPAFIQCRRTEGCPGYMASGFYPDPSEWSYRVPKTVDAEWYRPGEYTLSKMKKKAKPLYEHVIKGGLVMRRPQTKHAFPGEMVE